MKNKSLEPSKVKKQLAITLKERYQHDPSARRDRIESCVEYLTSDMRLPVHVSDIPGLVARLMKAVQNMIGMTGEMKKEVVVRVAQMYGPDPLKEMIPVLIEYFYNIDIDGLLNGPKIVASSCFPCLSAKR